MNGKQIMAGLFMVLLVIVTLWTYPWIPYRNDESAPAPSSSQEIGPERTEKESVPPVPERNSQNDSAKQPSSGKAAANLDDIIKASTARFPVRHTMENGSEWIRAAEVEDYLVLKTVEPPLRGTDIKGIQMILQKLKMYSGMLDGIYDTDVVTAIKKFQEFYGLAPTGVVDLDDYSLLAKVYEETIPTTAKAKPAGKVSVLVVLDERTLYVLEDGKIFHQFPVSVGTVDTPSPIGNWKIVSKDSWGGGFGTRWLGINVPYGKFGIHGTNKPWSISGAESHGCIRMFNRDIEVLYNWVTWGTRIYITGGQFPYNIPWRTIRDGDRGSDVWLVQNRLKELGYLKSQPDGVFGGWTKQLVMRFQKDQKLPVTGEVDWGTRTRMGFYNFQ